MPLAEPPRAAVGLGSGLIRQGRNLSSVERPSRVQAVGDEDDSAPYLLDLIHNRKHGLRAATRESIKLSDEQGRGLTAQEQS
jgi:hypothetical protein